MPLKHSVLLAACLLITIGTLARAQSIPERYRSVEPQKIGYKETGRFPAGLENPTALAVDKQGDLYLAGKQSIRQLSPEGKLRRTIELKFTPTCLTIDAQETILAASKNQIWQLTDKKAISGRPITRAILTSIAASDDHIFLADAANRTVWRLKRPFDASSQPEPLAKTFTDTKNSFVVPSPYFDLVLGHDGLLRIVDPGRHRIKHYTEDGRHEDPLDWGKAGFKLDEFPTCCNPAHIAILSDGSVVTVEKKIPRVKVYESDGTLRTVVVDPKTLIARRDFDTTAARLVVAVAVGPHDEIYLLDPLAKEVLCFEATR